MSESEKRRATRVPVAMRIKLRYRKLDSFISKFATNVSTEGMFISSRNPKEVGTELRFELRLADDSTVIAGRGKVAWVRPFDPDQPKEPHGMGIRFLQLSKSSKSTIETMVEDRLKRGLGDDSGIPYALDDAGSAETPLPPLPNPPATSKSPPAAKAAAPAPVPSPATLEAQSNGSAVPLTMEEIDTLPVDMSEAMRRARSLVANGKGDEALDELYRVSAAPVAASVDEASNELARILGGQAIKAQRTTRDDDVEDESLAPDAKTSALPMGMSSKS